MRRKRLATPTAHPSAGFYTPMEISGRTSPRPTAETTQTLGNLAFSNESRAARAPALHCVHNENAWKPMHFKWSGPLGSPTPPPKQCRCFKIYVIPMNQGPPRTPRPHSNFWGAARAPSKSIEMRRKSKKNRRKLYEITKIVWTRKTFWEVCAKKWKSMGTNENLLHIDETLRKFMPNLGKPWNSNRNQRQWMHFHCKSLSIIEK